MTKLLFAVLLVALVAMAPACLAQNEIQLGGTASNTLVFTGDGSGNFTLNLNPNPLSCSPSGCAAGQGEFSGYSGVYTLTSGLNNITGAYMGGGVWNISENTPILFGFGPTAGSNAYLGGDIQLMSLTQVANVGVFNDSLVANLTNLTGVLAPFFTGAGGIITLDIDFQTGQNLANLASGGTINSNISSGEIDTTPEPGTMALLGSGFLMVGGFLRKKFAA